MTDKYDIYCRDRKIHKEVSEEEMLDILADMADRFHETGDPDPDTIHVEAYRREWQKTFSHPTTVRHGISIRQNRTPDGEDAG